MFCMQEGLCWKTGVGMEAILVAGEVKLEEVSCRHKYSDSSVVS
jgi:hypothetical protein